MKCKKCEGKGRVPATTPFYMNCELGGDCSTIPGWKKEDCKICGTEECPDCKGKGNL